MAKRRLTKQQKTRIQHAQQKKRVKNTQTKLLANQPLGAEQNGLILSHRGQTLDVENDKGDVFRCFARQNLGDLVAGDDVVWCVSLNDQDNTGVILARKPRRSLLMRPDRYKQNKALAANIDQIIIVLALNPKPIRFYLDQYLVASELATIKPCILINKIDLLTSPHENDLASLIHDYESIGYSALKISAKYGQGIASLRETMQGQNNIFLGQSGVGKSSLINSLFEKALTKVQALSVSSQKGQHTTSTSNIYHLPHGGHIIDAPGIREFGLWHLSVDEIAYGFIEFQALIPHCQFRNCTHLNEQGCAIVNACHNGNILSTRLNSYHRLIKAL